MREATNQIQQVIDDVTALAAPEGDPADEGLALVARDVWLGERYRVWRGRSGRRYLVTVMPLGEALRAEGAIVLVVAITGDDERRILWAGESGSPLPALHLVAHERVEAHVHLLAANPEKRRAAVVDLVNGTQGYSSVISPSRAASQDSSASATPSLSNSLAVLRT